MSADLIARLIEAGTPAQLIADVAMALGRAAGDQEAIEQRRASDRARKARSRDITGHHVTARDTADETPAPSPPSPLSPQTPLKPQPPHPHPRDTTRSRKGTRLPADFEMPADWLEWAQAERSWTRTDAESEAGSFHDHWIAKPGKDGLKLDWQATWRNWVRGSRRNGRNGTGTGSTGIGGRPSAWESRFAGVGFEPASLDD